MTSTQPLPTYSPDTCMFCHQVLRITTGDIESDLESEEPEFERGEAAAVIDDVELYCGPPGSGPSGHHAHWACLIDHVKQLRAISGGTPISALATCVVCGQNALDSSRRFIVDVRNEGGETRGFDFGEILEEELFLDDHPNQVHIRAFHDLVAQGDYAGAIDLVAVHSVDVNGTYGSDGLTALQKATFSGDTSGAEFLKSLGATV